ncbi:MAG: spermidine synthase [Aeromicrobium sp.]|jgi:spermidine synthase|uniref:spermidine synthase n=1 Tax=Aeromicrobium sp. TaxID=1871063 RepID=UPI0026327ACF|nr:spermidine synthase [Aeromicrobium sp.]MCW2824619.1 spermidine synthase [Aeromicrobium sp.]
MARFREIDFRPTPMGDLVLRERWDPTAQQDLLEIKLGDEFLMSSLFTVAEIALGHLATAECEGAELDVVVGGLGLGCTALAVLDDPRVRSLVVVDALPEVIEWHREHLIPAGETLTADPRCRLVHGDFFAGLRDGGELDPESPGRLWAAVVVDIDHTPSHHLDPSHADLYDAAGLARVAARLHPGGVFALWSDDPPDEAFVQVLRGTFTDVRADVVPFDNPLTGGVSANTVYVARA